jgi:hypothetical protein
MNITKRALNPVRLAIPTLLALSVTAAWTPFESVSGVGFSADTITTSSATVEVKYDRLGYDLQIWVSAQSRNSSTGVWSWHPDINNGQGPELREGDIVNPVWGGITKPPVNKAILWIWDDNDTGNYALAEVSDP